MRDVALCFTDVATICVMANTIDIFADLRKVKRKLRKVGKSGRTHTRGAFQIDIRLPELKLTFDDKEAAQSYTSAILSTIKGNWRKGKQPDGKPLPSISGASVQRRQYREAQAHRSGEASDKIKDSKARSRSLKSWDRRYKTSRLGHYGDKIPENSSKRIFGYESGLLIESLVAFPKGDVFSIFAAKNRAAADKKGTSALERVFKRVPIWSKSANNQAHVQEALQDTIRMTIKSKANRAVKEALRTLRRLKSLGDSMKQFED